MKTLGKLSWVLTGLLYLVISPQTASGQLATVRAVLFYSPSCGHCHKVINEDLPPLFEQYGPQLSIMGIDVSIPQGQELYRAALEHFDVPEERYVVPILIVGETVLVGSQEIPERLPAIIEEGLSAGGIDWPPVPQLLEILPTPAQPSVDTSPSTPIASAPQAEQPSSPGSVNATRPLSQPGTAMQLSRELIVTRFSHDPLGNGLAVIVLVGMVASAFGSAISTVKQTRTHLLDWPRWLVPLLCGLGLFVALYLTYVETTRTEAYCGPFGDCNAVQQSPYAYLFGLIPIGALGVLGYLTLLTGWLIWQYGPERWRSVATLTSWGLAWAGVLFSIYLTFLEPFVIGATCAWCITSAIIMTLILWSTTKPASQAWNAIKPGSN